VAPYVAVSESLTPTFIITLLILFDISIAIFFQLKTECSGTPPKPTSAPQKCENGVKQRPSNSFCIPPPMFTFVDASFRH
jgi:hypothetical protein